ncbi:FAD-dependent oxidoreductase [Actinomycetota bacterium Odt1-20B]
MGGRSAIVVGGGIGGLATAVALRRAGWRVQVLERRPDFRELGAGLSLWPNALRALDALGLGERVRELALTDASAGIRDRSGRWLSRTDTGELARRHGEVAMVHRADLLDTLRAAVPAEDLRPGVTVEAVRADGTVLHSGTETRADLVIGADGIGSRVRRSLWPGAPAARYAGYTTWRMVTAPVPVAEGAESWGRGERFGYAPLPDGRVYAFAVLTAPEGLADRIPADRALALLRRRFGSWHAPVPDLLGAVEPGALLHHGIYELPPLHTFVTGRAALLGDAAHAMTPNLGQGACQALEDAVELADALARGGSVEGALTVYDRIRRPRVQMISARARRIGQVAQWRDPLAAGLRNLALRRAPAEAFLKSLDPVLDWWPRTVA